MNTINIPLDTTSYGEPATSHKLSLKGTRFRFGISYTGPEAFSRREFQGPKLPGPFAATYGLATCMSADPNQSTGAEVARNKAAGTEHEVEDGDLLTIDGNTFKVRRYDREFLKLDPQDSV